jgi:hypothetical protein
MALNQIARQRLANTVVSLGPNIRAPSREKVKNLSANDRLIRAAFSPIVRLIIWREIDEPYPARRNRNRAG